MTSPERETVYERAEYFETSETNSGLGSAVVDVRGLLFDELEPIQADQPLSRTPIVVPGITYKEEGPVSLQTDPPHLENPVWAPNSNASDASSSTE
ncbi:hypothetical protein IPJ72_07225 [Candidatus Peregrinibacteria bacterium]|nr:MAG: hypothetical protein IPJ72_07225 [Candidatus Peregrinibacteria bacterium]